MTFGYNMFPSSKSSFRKTFAVYFRLIRNKPDQISFLTERA